MEAEVLVLATFHNVAKRWKMKYPNRAIRRKHEREKHVTMAKVIKGVKHHVCTVPECSVEWADAPVEEME